MRVLALITLSVACAEGGESSSKSGVCQEFPASKYSGFGKLDSKLRVFELISLQKNERKHDKQENAYCNAKIRDTFRNIIDR